MLISSKIFLKKNSCTETSKILLDQISGDNGLAKLRHKINHHTICKNHLGHLLNIDSWAPSSEILILIAILIKLPGDAEATVLGITF